MQTAKIDHLWKDDGPFFISTSWSFVGNFCFFRKEKKDCNSDFIVNTNPTTIIRVLLTYLNKITDARAEPAKMIATIIVSTKRKRSAPRLVCMKDPPSEPKVLPISPFERCRRTSATIRRLETIWIIWSVCAIRKRRDYSTSWLRIQLQIQADEKAA